MPLSALKAPVTLIQCTIARQRYYARAAAYAQQHAVSLYGINPTNPQLFNASYEYALRVYFREHPAKYNRLH